MLQIVFTDAESFLQYLGIPYKPEMIVKEQYDHFESRNNFGVNTVSDFGWENLRSCILHVLRLRYAA